MFMLSQIQTLTMQDFLMGRDKQFPLTHEMSLDAVTTLDRVIQLLSKFGSMRKITSGYRPNVLNEQVLNAAKHSNHLVCRACDLSDPKGDLDRWCVANQNVLTSIGLWLESPTDTPGWCHVQIVPPKSGHRIFIA